MRVESGAKNTCAPLSSAMTLNPIIEGDAADHVHPALTPGCGTEVPSAL